MNILQAVDFYWERMVEISLDSQNYYLLHLPFSGQAMFLNRVGYAQCLVGGKIIGMHQQTVCIAAAGVVEFDTLWE